MPSYSQDLFQLVTMTGRHRATLPPGGVGGKLLSIVGLVQGLLQRPSGGVGVRRGAATEWPSCIHVSFFSS